ncbi:alpha/beta fold hydrolase [Pseudoalteromonas rubra]|uniref:alpha/beta fold hydrolase n=1 Tax=Pseudoalteromonas rubra TaxID=43658 RepID=UPI0005FA4C0C|nr:alpha/beta fold hydrolase [Pseudoalteromonas rubra]
MFYSESKHLSDNLAQIEAHWQACQKGTFDSPVGPLFYASHIPEHARFAVILVNGRIESAHKYQELIWEFGRNQVAVFTYDHPGQGLSGRFLSNLHIGYIERFAQYGDCLDAFINQVVLPQWHGQSVILAHSMGGAITCDYLTRYSSPAVGAFLSAPMLAINTAPYPAWLAQGIATTACALGLGQSYAVGQADYMPKAFADNELTQCELRYSIFRQLYQQHPDLQLGGVSFRWLQQALQFTQSMVQQRIDLPVSIASAQHDSIVCSAAHTHFAANNAACQLHHYPGKHELLCEKDTVRRAVLNQFYSFVHQLIGQGATTAPSLSDYVTGDTASDTGS